MCIPNAILEAATSAQKKIDSVIIIKIFIYKNTF